MENVGITGFDNEKPNINVREIIVRMADCGSSKLDLLPRYVSRCTELHQ